MAAKTPASECRTPGCCTCPGMSHCLGCGYTAHDKALLMDHRFCREHREAPATNQKGKAT